MLTKAVQPMRTMRPGFQTFLIYLRSAGYVEIHSEMGKTGLVDFAHSVAASLRLE
jgi:hypothetical protein